MQLKDVILHTDFKLPKQSDFYRGKVRDVLTIDNRYLVMIATDRISAFDVVLPVGIPYKGVILNKTASKFLDETKDIVPNWKIGVPHPMVTIGLYCQPFKVEMVIRGYLSGHAWREYKSGKRQICGVPMPDGMKENDKFPEPLITPTTKAIHGHDQDISKDEIINQGLVSKQDYEKLEDYTRKLFAKGSLLANKQGLILVDTKYEFGKIDDTIYLIDEVHTPDSSRYFYLDGYQQRQEQALPQKQLSKEFVREWLIQNGFQGLENQQLPELSDDFILSISDRYIELYEKITGEFLDRDTLSYNVKELENSVLNYVLKQLP